MSQYRTLDEVSAEYFSEHPEEIDDFLQEIFADYAEDGDSAVSHEGCQRINAVGCSAVMKSS